MHSLARRVILTRPLRRQNATKASIASHSVEVDELCMPIKPTWSVKELLASYPPPVLEPAHLIRLHELSALIPPPEGSPAFEKLRKELGELIRLVEAVRTVELPKQEAQAGVIPDGRIWPAGQGMEFTEDDDAEEEDLKAPPEPQGRELLKHAAETADGYYLVKSARRR